MELRIRQTGQVVTEQEFRKLYPNTSFPEVLTAEILESFEVDPIFEGPQPTTTPPYEISVRQGVKEVEGKWFTNYVVGPIFETTEEEIDYKLSIDRTVASSVRQQRDKLLQETDWVIIKAKETGSYISVDWKEYRQALRDITLQDGFPHNIVWPEKPE